jgi:hypothetical protein
MATEVLVSVSPNATVPRRAPSRCQISRALYA